jgi:hypothetical protein
LQFAIATKRGNREDAPSRASVKRDATDGYQEAKPVTSYPPPAPSSGWNKKQNSLRAREMTEAREPKKSVSMGNMQQQQHTGTPKMELQDNKEAQDINGNIELAENEKERGRENSPSVKKRKEYKSEYNNRFRPFSQYEYAPAEGKFVNTSGSPPSEIEGPVMQQQLSKEKLDNLAGEPWYQEVIQLRKQANDYKCRGWGTDLVPPHMNQLYNQQIHLYEQASTRQTLSALSLAITTPRSITKDEKEKENFRKSSPLKPRSSRPRTAPPSKGHKKASSRSESAQPTVTAPTPTNNKDSSKSEEQQDGKTSAGRSVSLGSPHRSDGQAQAQSQPGWKVHLSHDSTRQANKRQRPNSEARDKVPDPKRGISRSSSKAASRDHSRPPSAIENHLDYFKEPVVKSPPEPTRVKSPEQLMMRSPDPINWTVPLDTGKTFSVTQSVRDGDSARNSPMSDHSSHFDSVSGTAINLGVHTMNEKGSLHYPKVSALAREAKELQPKSSGKKETEKTEKPEKSALVEGGETGTKEEPLTDSFCNVDNVSNVGNVTNVGNGGSGGNDGNVNGTPAVPTNGDNQLGKENTAKVPGTNLKCLEDPNFSFDEPVPSSAGPPHPGQPGLLGQPSDKMPAPASSQPKKPSYRVLEDPFESSIGVPPAPISGGLGIAVLEDPGIMTASIYDQNPTTCTTTAAKQDPGKGRPEEVLSGAREQFDKFFNKGKDSSVTQ